MCESREISAVLSEATRVICLPSALQDLRCALQKSRSELQAKEAALKEAEAERHTAVQEKDRSITELKGSLQEKERQLQVAHSLPAACSSVDIHTFLIRSENLFICRSTQKCWSQQEAPNQETLCWRS